MSPVECKEQAAQCRRMAEGELNLRVQAILTDMAKTWDRLAIEAEISQSGPSLRVMSQLASQANGKSSS
jgi:predicted metalloprotease